MFKLFLNVVIVFLIFCRRCVCQLY